MQWPDSIGRRLKLRDVHILLAVVEAGAWREPPSVLQSPNPSSQKRSLVWSTPSVCNCSSGIGMVPRLHRTARYCSTAGWPLSMNSGGVSKRSSFSGSDRGRSAHRCHRTDGRWSVAGRHCSIVSSTSASLSGCGAGAHDCCASSRASRTNGRHRHWTNGNCFNGKRHECRSAVQRPDIGCGRLAKPLGTPSPDRAFRANGRVLGVAAT